MPFLSLETETSVPALRQELHSSIDRFEEQKDAALLTYIEEVRDKHRAVLNQTYGRGEWPDEDHDVINRVMRLFAKTKDHRPFLKSKFAQAKTGENGTKLNVWSSRLYQ